MLMHSEIEMEDKMATTSITTTEDHNLPLLDKVRKPTLTKPHTDGSRF